MGNGAIPDTTDAAKKKELTSAVADKSADTPGPAVCPRSNQLIYRVKWRSVSPR
jgi:hypothetical protein